jgi:heme A synthase
VTFGINLDCDFGTPFSSNQITKELASFQEQIEWTLRVASLIVGLMVGAMSLIAMVKEMRGR